jgi:hypothetical protein
MQEIMLPTSTAKGSQPFISRSLVNMFAEMSNSEQNRSRFVLKNAHGLAEYRDIDTIGGCRGILSTREYLYVVYGTTLFRLVRNTDNLVVSLGSIPSTGHVPMAYNGDELVCVADGRGFIYTESTNTLVEITDADFLPPSDVTFMDGYFIFTQLNSDTVFHSELYDGMAYNALDRIKIQRNPDFNVAIESMYSELWVFGSQTTELLQNSGATSPAFTPISNTVIEVGCAALASVVRIPDVGLMWLGNDRLIHLRANSGKTQVTPHEIANKIREMTRVDDAVAWFYMWGAHKFYVITFPTQDCTFVYDVMDNVWHERTTHNKNHWIGLYGAHYDSKILVGDAFDSKIHLLSNTFYKDGNEDIRRTIITPEIHAGTNGITVRELSLSLKVGGGAYTGNDTIRLYTSEDGGIIFNFVQERDFAEAGQYNKRVIFHNLGNYPNGVTFKIETAAQSPIEIIAAYIRTDTHER